MIPGWAVERLWERLQKSSEARGAVVREVAAHYKVSKATVYRRLQKLEGLKAGVAVTDEERQWAEKLAGYIHSTMNRKGIGVATESAIHELERMGKLPAGSLTRQRADNLLRAFGTTKKHMRKPRACVRLTAAGPNAWHQVDFTVAACFYLENMWVGLESEYRKVPAERTKLLIGCCTDVFSGCMFAKAYEAQGESAELAVQFLYDAWSQKPDLGFPFHGVPWNVYSDQASGLRSRPVQTLLDHLFVGWKGHLPGNKQATGLVERKFLDTARFEALMRGRLACGHKVSLQEFNSWLFEACVDLNNKPHTRFKGKTRFEAWSSVVEEEIRRCPEWDVFVNLTAVGEMRRRVSPYMTISLTGKEYFVGVSDLVGAVVDVYLSADRKVWVRFEGRVYGPLSESVPVNVLGSDVRQAPLSQSERNIKAAVAAARRLGIKRPDLAYIRDDTSEVFVPRPGRQVQHKASPVQQAPEPSSFTEVWQAKRWLADRLGNLTELGWENLATIERTLAEVLARDRAISVAVLEKIAGVVRDLGADTAVTSPLPSPQSGEGVGRDE